jgi:hypothetical protein
MERSEKLGRLNRRMCCPLDRMPTPDADEKAQQEGAVKPLRDD